MSDSEKSLTYESRIKEYAKSIQPTVKFSGDALDALDNNIKASIREAIRRAQGNGRVTIQAQDF